MAPMGNSRVWAACSAAALTCTTIVSAQPRDIVLTGTCSHEPEDILEGLRFRKMGRTRTGAPWYKSDELSQYLYFDPDCSGVGDGEGWIIDDTMPNLREDRDLDMDGDCQYRARCRWGGTRGPPSSALWFMECDDGWRYQPLKFLNAGPERQEPVGRGGRTRHGHRHRHRYTTSTETTTTTKARKRGGGKGPKALSETASEGAAPASAGIAVPREEEAQVAEAVAAPVAAAVAEPRTEEVDVALAKVAGGRAHKKKLKFSGACEMKAYLNGATFELQGTTSDGAPFYKAKGSEEYVYHQMSCEEGDSGRVSTKWVLDTQPPQKGNRKRKQADTYCDHNLAHLEDAVTEGPPKVATWRMICGDEENPVELTITLWEDPDSEEQHRNAPIVIAGAHGLRGSMLLLALPFLLGLAA